jgi:hypothetical protein
LLRVDVLTTHPVASRIGPSLPTAAHAWLSVEPRFEGLQQAFGAVHALLANVVGGQRRAPGQ